MNTSICVKSVHNVSFTGVESKKSPQIVLYKWSQRKNISCDQPTVKCAPFGFMNATSVNISRLGVVVCGSSSFICNYIHDSNLSVCIPALYSSCDAILMCAFLLEESVVVCI